MQPTPMHKSFFWGAFEYQCNFLIGNLMWDEKWWMLKLCQGKKNFVK